MIRVLIDATGITKEKAGVGVYAKNLLDQLTRTPDDFKYFVLAQDDDPELDFSQRPNVTMLWVRSRFFRILPLRFLLEQLYLPLLLRSRRINVIHSLHYAFPLFRFGARQVVTVHDMTFFNMPEVHQRTKIIYFRAFIRAAVRYADLLIFVSRSALEDCTARLGPADGATAVIPHGKGEEFLPGGPLLKKELTEKYKLPKRFMLYIGMIEPRKNLTRLVEAFAGLAPADSELDLVIAGKLGWMTESLFAAIERLNLASRVHFIGFIAEEDKPSLLAACTMFVYPSLYEGFGLPALEAIACGAPTITSNTSALPEVVGKAAILIDPTSVTELAAAMKMLLLSPATREDLRRRGPLQAAQFTWAKTASLTAETYRLVGQNQTTHVQQH